MKWTQIDCILVLPQIRLKWTLISRLWTKGRIRQKLRFRRVEHVGQVVEIERSDENSKWID